MFDQQKPVEECTAQELVADLMRQTACDALDPEQVLQDLSKHPELWNRFWMGPLLPLDKEGASSLSLIFLRDLPQFWHADTLYVLAKSQECLPKLKSLGFQWNYDTIQ